MPLVQHLVLGFMNDLFWYFAARLVYRGFGGEAAGRRVPVRQYLVCCMWRIHRSLMFEPRSQ